VFPHVANFAALILMLAWFILDNVDEIHAFNTGNDSPLTVLFDSICSSLGCLFLAVTLCDLFQIQDLRTQWVVTQLGQLVLLTKHVQAYYKGRLTYSRMRGPGEAVFLFAVVLVARGYFGVGPFRERMQTAVTMVAPPGSPLEEVLALKSDQEFQAGPFMRTCIAFQVILMLNIVRFLFVTSKAHGKTSLLIMLSLCMLVVPRLIETVTTLHLSALPASVSLPSVFSDGLLLSVLTTDVVVSRMAQREVSPFVVLISMIAFVSVPLTFASAAIYFAILIGEISAHSRLPVLTINTNVYIDGIYDMLHIGHLRHFERAAQLGTRLFVGVVNDADATPYKRRPIMTEAERYELVAASKWVYKVIPDAPCVPGGLNEAFIKKHNIHIVAHGEEYDKKDDVWYVIPRQMGITRILPRTMGMSTSDLIKRIMDRAKEPGVVKDVMR